MTALSIKLMAPAFLAASLASAHAEDTAALEHKKAEAYSAAGAHLAVGLLSGAGSVAGILLTGITGISTMGTVGALAFSASTLAGTYSVVEINVAIAAFGLASAGQYDDSIALSKLSTAAIKAASNATTLTGSGTLIVDSVMGTPTQNTEKNMDLAANVEKFVLSLDGIKQSSLTLLTSPHVIKSAIALGSSFNDIASALDGLAKELQAPAETPKISDHKAREVPTVSQGGGSSGGSEGKGTSAREGFNGVERRDFEDRLQNIPDFTPHSTRCNPGQICVTAPPLRDNDYGAENYRELEEKLRELNDKSGIRGTRGIDCGVGGVPCLLGPRDSKMQLR